MVSISLCMIVKNEESILARCLDSLKDLMDEIIIVDTGSTDRTKEIAARYTDKIYDFEWTNDFASARNFSFSKATKDYIYVADADELLDSHNQEQFRKLKEVLLSDVEIVQMHYVISEEFNTVYNSKKEYRPKLFKRLRNFNWISPIHETVNLTPIVFDSDIEVLHLPQADHTKRDFSTFINAVDRGQRLEGYALIMFCKELFISGEDEDFLAVRDIFTNILAKEKRSDDEMKNIACVLARIYRLTGNYNEFFKVCLKDIAVDPCAEICMELGNYFYSLGDYAEAVIWFLNAASETPSILNIHSSGDFPLLRLSECYHELAKEARSNKNYDLYDVYCANSTQYLCQAEAWEMPSVV